MPTIRLHPERHAAPVCASYDSLEAVRQFERAVRVHRAFAEAYEITPVDNRPDGAYRITGASGGQYVVDLVDASGRNDACTCPDFLTNRLGTCKHVEAVRMALPQLERRTGSAWSLPLSAHAATLTVDAEDSLTLKACGTWDGRLYRQLGVLPGAGFRRVVVPEGVALRPGFGESGVRVVHAAAQAVEQEHQREQRRRRAADFCAAVADGKLGIDVLAHPLFPYQQSGVVHLAGAGRALLADDMGLGKTVQAIAACEVLLARGEARRVVIVTPASLREQWAREIRRFTGREAVVVAGPPARRRAALASDAPYKVLNYELTWRELPGLKALAADVLVLDEAQRAKNFRTKTAATLRAIPSQYLFVLTGTPVENRLDDLFSILQLVDQDLLGPLWRFNLDFHQQDERGRVTGCKNLSRLRERIATVVMRRRKEEVLTQLPPLVEQTRYIALTPEQARLEAHWAAEAARYAAIARKRPLTPREHELLQMCLLKARQACNAAVLCDPETTEKGSPKLDELEALVAEIVEQGAGKVIVFSEWVEMLKLAAARLDGLGVGWAMLYGGVPVERRAALLDTFRADPGQRVLLSSDAGGLGLNLQVANYVIHLDLPWNPARLDQRTSRAHRIGQTRGVMVTLLCGETGVERGIERTLAAKRLVRVAALDADSTVDEVEGISATLFARQVADVLEGPEATGGRELPGAAAGVPGGEAPPA